MADQPISGDELHGITLRDSGLAGFEMTDRDRACLILDRIDYEEQLRAMKSLLARNRTADKQLEAERDEIDESIKSSDGVEQEHAIDDSGVNFYAMVYQSAAHSMAALGMLAPMYESIFYQAFQGIRNVYFESGTVAPGHHRSVLKADDFWNCHKHFEKKDGSVNENVVSGILQLVKAVGLKKHLPKDLAKTLEALFDYRNFMFHNGFEWPADKCGEFALHIDRGKWKAWFEWSERSDKPWIFYMTDDFIKHCLETIDRILDGFGLYCKEQTPLNIIPIEQY
jgi:hypothetical protein